jgi:CTP:molybdopterin cytidylyltransferase MocA
LAPLTAHRTVASTGTGKFFFIPIKRAQALRAYAWQSNAVPVPNPDWWQGLVFSYCFIFVERADAATFLAVGDMARRVRIYTRRKRDPQRWFGVCAAGSASRGVCCLRFDL